MPRSEKKTDIFGNEYTQHYDDNGNKSGWSETKTDIFGGEYDQHYDNDSRASGRSEEKTDIFGDRYEQSYDSEGVKLGWSEERKGIFGDEYYQHFDQAGSKSGWSEEKTNLLGDKYYQHHGVATKNTALAERQREIRGGKISQSISPSETTSAYVSANRGSTPAERSHNSNSSSGLGTFIVLAIIGILISLILSEWDPELGRIGEGDNISEEQRHGDAARRDRTELVADKEWVNVRIPAAEREVRYDLAPRDVLADMNSKFVREMMEVVSGQNRSWRAPNMVSLPSLSGEYGCDNPYWNLSVHFSPRNVSFVISSSEGKFYSQEIFYPLIQYEGWHIGAVLVSPSGAEEFISFSAIGLIGNVLVDRKLFQRWPGRWTVCG